ncbi:MAG TPA: hypothetical protein PLJ27_21360 [Polyangiaceae bacterium]|nr:hypothetical protein [Polyangiaceae bacterium]HNZ24861.1 hypothetical protein [Polyangiaceae bacterium]HOD22069.1 hypothetical protein [Polyangiaceae bacterium]HOE51886.1 hypothetical protein [Polyangiaceae bacterium]HOH02069.1 hypothetical protein [Polyangiaceae bacterium]
MNEWSLANEDPENDASDSRTAFSYDSKNDVFILIQPLLGTVRAYDAKTRLWKTLTVHGPTVRPHQSIASYYDPVHNVHVSLDKYDKTMWLFRYAK